DLESEALLACGRHIGKHRSAFGSRGGDRLDVAGLHLWPRGRRRIAHVIDSTGDQVLHRGSKTAIGNVDCIYAEGGIEQDTAHMGCRSSTSRAKLRSAMVCLHVSDEFGKRI